MNIRSSGLLMLLLALLSCVSINAQSSPMVQANIYKDKPFKETKQYLYIKAWQTGLNLKFDHTNACFTATYGLLDDLFYFHQNRTLTGHTAQHTAFNISQIVAGNFASFVYGCYRFEQGILESTQSSLSQFVDITDVYTSFLFNLLANSIKIKSISTAMTKA